MGPPVGLIHTMDFSFLNVWDQEQVLYSKAFIQYITKVLVEDQKQVQHS